MIVPFGELKRNYLACQTKIDTAITQATGSGWYLFGKEQENFERNFARYCQAECEIDVVSGTDAIQIVLSAVI